MIEGKHMAKALELIGLGLVAIMTLGFVGAFEPYGVKNGLSELFWGCAGGTLLIIIYRKMQRKREKKKKKKKRDRRMRTYNTKFMRYCIKKYFAKQDDCIRDIILQELKMV